MFRLPGRSVLTVKARSMLTAKTGYVAACAAAALTLVTSGIAHTVQSQLGAFGGGSSVVSGSSTGAMNILLMGLESRTDFNGNILSSGLLTAMHAGSVQGVRDGVGGNASNTLILIHIFAGGQRAVAFSIPRDDFVSLQGTMGTQSMGKIDQAYGTGMIAEENKLAQQSPDASQSDKMHQANVAGQTAEIKTVEGLTGVPINHFAVINLEGFYELAQAFNGVEVCLKSWNGGENLHDSNSGFKVASPGYHHLAAPQALAFVRERDNLPNGDLDRTHRQQAVLDYVIWKLEHQGMLSDVGQLSSLLNAARQYVITDPSWNLLQFAGDMKSLTGSRLKFLTLPVLTTAGQVTMDGQAQTVNFVDPGSLRQEVQQAFSGAPGRGGAPTGKSGKPAGGGKSGQSQTPGTASLSPSATTVDVLNGGQTTGLAGEVSSAVSTLGYKAGKVASAPTPQANTEVLQGTGTAANATKLARDFSTVPIPSSSVPAGHVQIVLGARTSSVPEALTSPQSSSEGSGSATSGSTAGSGSDTGNGSSASSTGGTGGSGSASGSGSAGGGGSGASDSGGSIQVKDGAQYGIPCVY